MRWASRWLGRRDPGQTECGQRAECTYGCGWFATKCTSNKQKHRTGKRITSYGFPKRPQRRGSDKTAGPTPDCDNSVDRLDTNLHVASGIKHTIYSEEHRKKPMETCSVQRAVQARRRSLLVRPFDRKTPFQTFKTFCKRRLWKVYNIRESSAYNQGVLEANTCSLLLWLHLYFQRSWRPSLIVSCCSDAHRVRRPSSLRPVGPVHHHLTAGRTGGAEGAGQSDAVSSGRMHFCWSVDGDGQDGPRGCGGDDDRTEIHASK